MAADKVFRAYTTAIRINQDTLFVSFRAVDEVVPSVKFPFAPLPPII